MSSRLNDHLKPSQEIIDFIKREQGLSLKPYLNRLDDYAIGYGSIHYEDGLRVYGDDDEITEEYADYLLQLSLITFADCINDNVQHRLEQHQFDALLSFAFYLGIPSFKASALLTRVNNDPNDIKIAIDFIKWNRERYKFNRELALRRQKEANIYFYGEYE